MLNLRYQYQSILPIFNMKAGSGSKRSVVKWRAWCTLRYHQDFPNLRCQYQNIYMYPPCLLHEGRSRVQCSCSAMDRQRAWCTLRYHQYFLNLRYQYESILPVFNMKADPGLNGAVVEWQVQDSIHTLYSTSLRFQCFSVSCLSSTRRQVQDTMRHL